MTSRTGERHVSRYYLSYQPTEGRLRDGVLACLSLDLRAGRIGLCQLGAAPKRESHREGRVHVVPSTKETVQLGVYDANLATILTIDSSGVISFPDTWSHFLNEMQPGVTVDTLAKLRVSNPCKGPHSIIGPIAVNKAEPGDVLEIRYEAVRSAFKRSQSAVLTSTRCPAWKRRPEGLPHPYLNSQLPGSYRKSFSTRANRRGWARLAFF